MKLISKYIVLLFIFGQANANAQSDMVMLRPIDFSPGMVGNSGTRISLSSQGMNFFSYVNSCNASLSYDFFSEKLKGGIGISYSNSVHDRSSLYGTGPWESSGFELPIDFHFAQTTSHRLNAVYAPKFVFNRKLQFSPFVKLSATHVNNGNLAHSLDRDIQMMPLEYNTKHNVLSGSLGFLFNRQKWFIGMETYGFNTVLTESTPLSRYVRFNYQMGMFFKFTKDHKYGVSVVITQDFAPFSGDLSPRNSSLLTTFKLNKLSLLLSHHRGYFGTISVPSNRVGLGYKPTERIKIALSTSIGGKNQHFDIIDYQIGFQYIIKKKDQGFF